MMLPTVIDQPGAANRGRAPGADFSCRAGELGFLGPADRSVRPPSARLGVLIPQVAVHVGLPDPVGTTYSYGRQLSGLNQPVNGHV